MAGLTVGITVLGGRTDTKDLLWSSGIGQNVAYLVMLFQRLPEVGQVVLIACPDGENAFSSLLGVPLITQAEAIDRVDLIIELAARAFDDDETARIRARGAKLVSYMAGNVLALNFEAVAHDPTHGDSAHFAGFDAVWITPQFWRMCRSYASLVRSPRVEIAPHIWHPFALTQDAFHLRKNPYYRRPAKGWKLGCFEPNISVVKTFHLPLLVAEEGYRRRPDLIEQIILFNTYRLKDNEHFNQLIAALDLGRDKKVFIEHRHPLASVMGSYVDAVISHHWENGLNYLYWEVLYLGWPLIHNASEIKDVGYYFPDFDPQTGGEVLVEALEHHAAHPTKDRAAAMETLWRFSIDNPEVQRAYSGLIEGVMS